MRDKHKDTTHQNASFREKHRTEMMQFNKLFNEYKPHFVTMVEQYEPMRDEHAGRITDVKHRTVFNPLDNLSYIHNQIAWDSRKVSWSMNR